jgi:Nucleotidyl transferase AbiEii toxin, Type IV TA system
MDKVARMRAEDRQDIFIEAAARLGIRPAIIEKDFWVCLVLKLLFEKSRFAPSLVFKGGTSLSKAHGLIERFSEDIDLVLDWQLIGFGKGLKPTRKSTEWRRPISPAHFARSWTIFSSSGVRGGIYPPGSPPRNRPSRLVGTLREACDPALRL